MSKGQLFSSISLQDYWKAFLIFSFFFFFLQIRQKVNEQHSSWLNNFLKEIPVNELLIFIMLRKLILELFFLFHSGIQGPLGLSIIIQLQN